jgi:flagellar export protein FliJ
MPFRFPLEAVLHLRRSLERQQELRLRAANQQVGRVRRLIDLLDGRERELQSHFAQQLREGSAGAELHFGLLCQDTLSRQRVVLQRELLRLEQSRDEQQKVYEQARRERETFESLREHQWLEYRGEAARREQRELDDTFLLRKNQSRQDHARHG